MKSLLNVNLHLKCFHSTSCLLEETSKGQKFCGMCRIPDGIKFIFSQWKTYFFPIYCTSDFFPIH